MNWSQDRLKSEQLGSVFKCSRKICSIAWCRIGIKHHGGTPQARRHLVEQFHPLATYGSFHVEEAGDIAPWSREVGNQTGAHRIRDDDEHHRNSQGLLVKRDRNWSAGCEDYIGPQIDYFFHDASHLCDVACTKPIVDPDIAPIEPSKLTQSLIESLDEEAHFRIILGEADDGAQTSLWPSLLRPRSERPCGGAAEKPTCPSGTAYGASRA